MCMKGATKYFVICLGISAVLLSFGCTKQLDQVPETSITDANYWNTPRDLELACNYLYSALPGFNGAAANSLAPAVPGPYEDLYTNDAAGQVPNQVSNGSRLPQANSFEWTNAYKLIRVANNILGRSVQVRGDAAVVQKYVGEACFFRAWGYFELVKRFGDVPLITTTLEMTDSLLYAFRTARETVMDSIYADLDRAAAYCPPPAGQPAAEYGRITSSAALAFKSRVALFAGTWNKFHGGAGYARHLQSAVEASGAVMDRGYHQLFEYPAEPAKSYYYLFQYAGEGEQNKENILVRLYGQHADNNISSHSYVRSSLEQGNIAPSRALMDAYLYVDGLAQGKSQYDSSTLQTSSLTEFRNRDPRINMTVFSRNDLYPTIAGPLPYAPGIQYRAKKYFIVEDWSANLSFVDYIIIRYAEVLLNHLEALFELNGAVSDDQFDRTINPIRRRAGMPVVTNAFFSTHGLDIGSEIRRERRVELAQEGFRYWDLLRWKTAEYVLPQAVLGPKYFPDEMIDIPNTNFTPDGFAIREPASSRSFDPRRDYLWPLPTRELGLNPNLVQNPDW